VSSRSARPHSLLPPPGPPQSDLVCYRSFLSLFFILSYLAQKILFFFNFTKPGYFCLRQFALRRHPYCLAAVCAGHRPGCPSAPDPPKGTQPRLTVPFEWTILGLLAASTNAPVPLSFNPFPSCGDLLPLPSIC